MMSFFTSRHVLLGLVGAFFLFLLILSPSQQQLVAQVATPPVSSAAEQPAVPFPTPDESLICEVDPLKLNPCHAAVLADQLPPENLVPLANVPCVGGMAGSYPCQNIDLLSLLPLSTFSSPGTSAPSGANDIWGWTDPLTNKEYALIGLTNGTAFVDITDPINPLYLGKLPTHTANSTWRDLKVYENHAFIVSEASGHGIQVFDLTQLRTVFSPPVTFANTAHYNQFGRAHNIAINEETGFAYAIGVTGTNSCSGGLHMVNISNPTSPTFAGCFSTDGYTHDTQCVVYNGPDATHVGKEICFNSNEDTLTIVDVTTKNTPVQLSRTGYAFSAYSHQGWLTDDQNYFLMNDELDEQSFGVNTKTHIWNVQNLDMPVYLGAYTSPVSPIDHNLYIQGERVFESNYRGGLRVLDITGIGSVTPTEVGYFDIYPSSNTANFNGTWSNYPYFPSGSIIVSGIEQGLFVLKLTEAIAITPTPSSTPTNTPIPGPSATPTNTPTTTPTPTASNTPTITATPTASSTPTSTSTATATATATSTATATPTPTGTATATPTPTATATEESGHATTFSIYMPFVFAND